MRIVITGGAGFIGSHLCDRFNREGHEVVAIDNLITGSLANIQHLMDAVGFQFINHDVSKYISVDGSVDVVMHFASPASPKSYTEFAIQTLKVGGLGTHNALGLAKANRSAFVLASTSEVYGDPEVHPQPETYRGNVSCTGPRAMYDEAKRYAEAMTMSYHRVHNIDTRIVRIFNSYGQRMALDDGRVVPNFVGQALRGEPLTVYGDGSQTRSFCYVSDLIAGIVRLIGAQENGPVNIGNPDEISILDFAKKINELTDNPAGIVHQPLPPDDPTRRCPDITRARRLLDWTPQVDLDEGMEKTIAWFRGEIRD
ncbi:MAG: UDP-glucose 4-epimerase [Anaerolineales bacterium]|nr:UDP-glucose 4-epimerase [Anaerolineales bacterium]